MTNVSLKDLSIISLAALLGAYVWARFVTPDLPVAHPKSERAFSTISIGEIQRVDAYLWENPFDLVESADKGSENYTLRSVNAKELRHWIKEKVDREVRKDGGSPVCIDREDDPCVRFIGFLSDANSRPSTAEGLRRNRTAFNASLYGTTWENYDNHHIGRLEYKAAGRASKSIHVPFEMIQKVDETGDRRFALLFWLDEDAFFGRDGVVASARCDKTKESLCGIREFAENVGFGDAQKAPKTWGFQGEWSDESNQPLWIIGPQDSNKLKDLIERILRSERAVRRMPIERNIVFVSPYATTPDAAIAESLRSIPTLKAKRVGDGPVTAKTIATALADARIRLVRTIADDDVVIEGLLAELARRVPSAERPTLGLGGPKTPLTLVTVSSRGDLFAENLRDMVLKAANRADRGAEKLAALNGMNVLSYEFFPGMNEISTIQERRAEGEGLQKGSKNVEVPIEAPRQPDPLTEGDQAYDYVDRLSAKVQTDAQAKLPFTQPFAIGILGGAPNDKVTLLRALRSKFPASLFFSTDLDAIYLRREHIAFTRNMLLAAAYPLTAGTHRASSDSENDGIERRGLPPFRTSYQTAVARAAKFTLSSCGLRETNGSVSIIPCEHDGKKGEELRFPREGPEFSCTPSDVRRGVRVFEVGRTKFVELPNQQMLFNGAVAETYGAPMSFGEKVARLPPFAAVGLLVGILASLLVGGYWFGRVCFGDELAKIVKVARRTVMLPRRLILTRGGLFIVIGLVTIMVATIWAFVDLWISATTINTSEPDDVLEGVSVWFPTGLRLLGVLIGLMVVFGFVVSRLRRPSPWEPSLPAICARALGATVALSLLMEALFFVGGRPAEFIGGAYVYRLNWWAGRASAWTLFFLLFLATVEAGAARRWLRGEMHAAGMAAVPRVSGLTVAAIFGRKNMVGTGYRNTRLVLGALETVNRVARDTARVLSFVYAPFLVLALLLVSTSNVFEYFFWPSGAVIVLSIVVAIALWNVLVLPLDAVRERDRLAQELERHVESGVLEARGRNEWRARLESTIRMVRETKTGVFRPITEQPIVRAAFLPAGAGVVYLILEFLLSPA